jgi:hypothetical protein
MQSQGMILLCFEIARVELNVSLRKFGLRAESFPKLRQYVFSRVAQSLVVCAFGAISIWSCVLYLYEQNSRFAHRVLNPLPFGILLLTMIINHIVISEAIHLRANKQENFLVNFVVGACLMLSSFYLLGKNFGAFGLVTGYLTITILVGLCFGSLTFFKYQKVWHAD